MTIELMLTIVVIIAVALALVWVIERFSPDTLITQLLKLAIFVAVLVLLVRKLWPLMV
jgi:hypothetical protein